MMKMAHNEKELIKRKREKRQGKCRTCVCKHKKAEEYSNFKSCATDPNGSYTGSPIENGEKPIQDADDL